MLSNEQPRKPSRSLAGKVAIVTGAGSEGDSIGNGRAISVLLAEDGAAVVCVDRHVELAEGTAEMIRAEGKGKAIACRGDVTIEKDCAAIVNLAVREFGGVDILVNSVGIIGAKGTAVEADVAEWSKGLEINVTSMMLMAKYAIPVMLLNEPSDGNGNIRGSIVNMGSVAGLQGGTPSLLYPTSKGAVVNMTRAMAANHARQGIRVNCVCPGMLYTPMMYAAGGGAMSQAAREARRKRSLLQTEGNAWDCAGAVRFLSGNEARWITGTVMTVDAGATCASMADD